MDAPGSADTPDSAALAAQLVGNIARAVIGKSVTIELLLVALICEGHVLLEDMPGVGKTLLAKSLARSLGCSFKRIQFTPDLLPADITGSRVFNQRSSEFEFRPGPLFAQIVLADEINRATPRTQAALLEAMEERQITADGVTMKLDRPFLVLATQNPIELEGTFALPEAQLDRFLFRLSLGYPTAAEESEILLRAGDGDPSETLETALTQADLKTIQARAARIHLSDDIRRYLIAIVHATRDNPDILIGGSPRASLALFRAARALACIRGRAYVLPDDIKHLTPAVLGHRVILTQGARIKVQDVGALLTDLVARIPAPVENDPTRG